jgi:hypothetical protein
MVASTKDTSTATVISTNISCSNCPRISTPENTSQAILWNDLESFGHFYSELEKRKKMLPLFERSKNETRILLDEWRH